MIQWMCNFYQISDQNWIHYRKKTGESNIVLQKFEKNNVIFLLKLYK